MIWIFDSWFWWLQTLKYFKQILPQYDYNFLADSKNAPYGEKSANEIKRLTYMWLNWLFDNWSQIVILACNTASAYAVRSWQTQFPEKKVLSVTIPWIEKIITNNDKKIWLLATSATISSEIFEKKYCEMSWWNCDFFSVAAPDLVRAVEDGLDGTQVEKLIEKYLLLLPQDLDSLVLWCTHFPVLLDHICNNKYCNYKIIDPAFEAAKAFEKYLNNHIQLQENLSQNWKILFHTTWASDKFVEIGSKIWGEKFIAKNIVI